MRPDLFSRFVIDSYALRLPDPGRLFLAALLIMDDDETIREALSEPFSEEHVCHTAGTAEEALARLQEQDYDAVITDISMPGMSGEDLLGLIKAYRPRTPVIFITGAADRDRSERLMKRGAFGCLLKPFRLAAIADSVARLLESRK